VLNSIYLYLCNNISSYHPAYLLYVLYVQKSVRLLLS